MDGFSTGDLGDVLADRPLPLVSLSLPTHQGGSGQGPLAWRGVWEGAVRRQAVVGSGPAEPDPLPARPSGR